MWKHSIMQIYRAVYTREHKPRLTLAAAYVRRERPVQVVQNLRSRLTEPTASSSRGISWRKRRETASINRLKRCPRFAEAVNDCSACSVFNYIPDLHGQETRAAVAGKWPAARESQKFRLTSSASSISGISLYKPLDWPLTNFSWRFPHKLPNSPALILTEKFIWNEKDSVKYGAFPDQSQSFRFLARSSHCCKLHEAQKQTTSLMNRSDRVLSREPFIRAVRVLHKLYSQEKTTDSHFWIFLGI